MRIIFKFLQFLISDIRILLVVLIIYWVVYAGYQKRTIEKQTEENTKLRSEVVMYEGQIIEFQKLILPLRNDKIKARLDLEKLVSLHEQTKDTVIVERNNAKFWKDRVDGVQAVVVTMIDSLRGSRQIILRQGREIERCAKIEKRRR